MENTFSAHEATRKRRRWGCTCGCLIFLLLAIFGGFGVLYYSFRPIPEAPIERWMNASTSGFILLRASTEDAGINEVFKANLKHLQEQQDKEIPESDRKALSAGFAILKQFLGGFFVHKNVPTYLQFDPQSGAETYLTVVQLKNLTSWFLLKILFSASDLPPAEVYKGAEIRTIPAKAASTSGTQIALLQRYVLFSNDSSRLRSAIEAAKSRKAESAPSQRLEQYVDDLDIQHPPDGEDLIGVIVNDHGRLDQLLSAIEQKWDVTGLKENTEQLLAAQKVSLSDVFALRISMDVMSVDKISFGLSFFCRNQDVGKRLNAVLTGLATHLREGNRSKVVQKADVKSEGATVILTLELVGMKPWLTNLVTPARNESHITSGTAELQGGK